MANFEIMETGISTVDFSEIQNHRLKQSTQKIMKLMLSAKKNLFEIAVTLKKIDSESLYEQDGFQNVAEYGEKVLGYKRLMTSNLIRVASNYINDDMKSILASETKDYSVSQLQELLTISVDEAKTLNDNQLITPDMTTREIRKAVKDYKNGESIIDVESEVEEVETETELQTVDMQTENVFNKAYESFHEHYNSLRKYLDGVHGTELILDDLQSIMDSVVTMYNSRS